MVTTVSDVCNVSNVQLHVLIKKINKKESLAFKAWGRAWAWGYPTQ